MTDLRGLNRFRRLSSELRLRGQTVKNRIPATTVIMATARQSVNSLADAAGGIGVTVAVIGDAIASRGTYEAVFEGHRHGRAV